MTDAAGRESPRHPIRVVLVDDHQMVLDGLVAMLRPHAERVEVVGATSEPDEARRLVADLEPDVCLLDVRLRQDSGFEVCVDLRRRAPATRVVFLTVYEDEAYVFEALQAGASGYLLKQVIGPELVRHLERVLEGEIAIDPGLAGRVALSAARLQRGEFWPGARLGLTQRESEVLGLMVRGLSNRAIARELVVGEETVKTHVGSIYRKLAVADRAQAVAAALREGLYR
ncbi:MAG TPA: response regulator transcription factor [Acidimicrobiia bacterium]|nr:response regulator transcription factor [Acidimicrobiia bacterium]